MVVVYRSQGSRMVAISLWGDGGTRKRTSHHLKMAALLMVFWGKILPSIRQGGWSQPPPPERASLFFYNRRQLTFKRATRSVWVGRRRRESHVLPSSWSCFVVVVILFVIYGDFSSVASITQCIYRHNFCNHHCFFGYFSYLS